MAKRSVRLVSAALAAVVIAASSPAAFAQNKAAAVQLFDEAKKLMDAGKFADACPKLEASRRMDPSADGVVLRLAACYQGMGRWASAWGLYRESLVRAEKAKRQDRIDAAKKGIAETEAKLSYVTFDVPAAARVTGLEIKWDDKGIDEGAWGTSIPVDPGEHTLIVAAPGRKTWEHTIAIASTAEKKTVDVPVLESTAPASPSPASEAVPPPSPSPIPVRPGAGDEISGRSNTAAYVALGAGALLVAGGVGSYFVARSARDDYFDGCAQQLTPACQDDAGRTRVRTWETVAFVAGGVGLAALGVGVVLLTRGAGAEKRATVTATPVVGGATGFVVTTLF